MELSIEEAVQRVKAEIIAPDWRLSARRIESLEEAFACLEEPFRDRKEIRAVLTMAGNVLQYVKTKGDHSPPDSVDFLKEAMADVVNLYEEPGDDPEREERVFQKVFAHFQELKEKIKSLRGKRPPGRGPRSPAGSAAAPPAAEEPQVTIHGISQPCSSHLPSGKRLQGAGDARHRPAMCTSVHEQADNAADLVDCDRIQPQLFRASAVEEETDAASPPAEAERLLAELNRTLQRAEEVGASLQELLQAAAAIRTALQPGEMAAAALPRETPAPPASEAGEKKCPPTDLREIMIGDRSVGLPEENVALIRPLAPAAREKYLREGQVELRDFHRLFSSLPRQFEGMLATIPGRKLKRMILPVISFQAVGMPELPDAQASTLLVLSYGHWHGVLFCSGVREDLHTMMGFRKAANGDIAGLGLLEGGGELPVANVADLLRREGFLAIV